MTSVLIGEISSYKAIVIAQYLRKKYNDISIFSFDYHPFTKNIHSKYTTQHFVLNYASKESYIAEISKLTKQLNIDLFIPVHSDFIEEVLKNRNLFGKTIDYLGTYGEYLKLHDKRTLQSIARNLNIDTPAEFTDINSSIIPFVGKPNNKSSSKGVVYVKNETQFAALAKNNFTDYIFQQYIPGKGCGYSVYANNGKIITGYGHLRLAEYPVAGGSSVYRETFVSDKMKIAAEKILTQVKWTGFAMFEFKLTPNQRLVLIEVNPRIWGSINQGLQNGTNYFESIILAQIKNPGNREDVKTYLSPQVFLSLFKYMLKGNLKPSFTFIRNFFSNKPDVSFINDPKGWLSIVLRFFYK